MLFFSLLYGLSQSLHTGVQCQKGSPGGETENGEGREEGREQGCFIVSQDEPTGKPLLVTCVTLSVIVKSHELMFCAKYHMLIPSTSHARKVQDEVLRTPALVNGHCSNPFIDLTSKVK